jgi:hypothetical protein
MGTKGCSLSRNYSIQPQMNTDRHRWTKSAWLSSVERIHRKVSRFSNLAGLLETGSIGVYLYYYP